MLRRSFVAVALAAFAVVVAGTDAHARAHRHCPVRPGLASFYGGGEKLNSHTASGQRFHSGRIAAAHRCLEMGTRVRVTNQRNRRSVVVVINDRGPNDRLAAREIDLTAGAFRKIATARAGLVPVTLQVVR